MSERSSVHRPEIDGLRAFAVLPVILFHAGVPGFSGGFVGVDVFFVISGYLITNLLMVEMEETGRVSILGFYERRARRLVPALLFMLAIVSVLAGFILWPALLIEFGVNAAASAVFLSNVSLWLQGGYFGGPSETNALLHTWSLAVEEQYYILVPPALWFAWWLGQRRAVTGLILLSIIASLIVAQLGTVYQRDANYYLLPSRAWELMIGALATLIWPRGGRIRPALREPLGWIGMAMILWSVVFISEETPFPSIWALPATVGTAFVLISAGPGTWIGRLLTLRIFVFFGLISYSLYLWHQPLLALYRVHAGDVATATGLAAMVVLSVVMGWISWRFVERPFRNRAYLSRAQVFAGTIGGFACVGAAGLVFVITNGMIDRYPPHLRSSLALSMSQRADYVRGRYTADVRDRAYSGDMPRVLIIGDSFSEDFYNALLESGAFAGYQISADYIAARCQLRIDGQEPAGAIDPGDAGRCARRDNRVNDNTLSRAREADIVVLSFFWRDWAVQQLPQTLEALNLRPETEVIIVGSKYFDTPDMHDLIMMSVEQLRTLRAPMDAQTRDVNRQLETLSGDWTFVDVADLICDTPVSCRTFTPEGEMISHDGRHLTVAGARYIGDLLFSTDGPLGRFGPSAR